MAVPKRNEKIIAINGIEFHKYYACDAHGTECSHFWMNGKLVTRKMFFEYLDAQLWGWTKIR